MRLLTRNGLCSLVLVTSAVAATLTGCGNSDADRAATPASGTTQEETARSFFDRFPSGDYESFAEAEAAAGYHIPRPSGEFPNLHGDTTHLQWLPDLSAPVSNTYYGPIQEGTAGEVGAPIPHIRMRVAVSGLFDNGLESGDSAIMRGEEVDLGGKHGWLSDSDILLFNYVCGDLKGETLWCSVMERNGIDRATFGRFVESLH